jgi:hypothetical protein
MNPALRSTGLRFLRSIAAVLSLAILFNQMAHAAHIRNLHPTEALPQTAAPPVGPVPSQIPSAHTIFLVNGGADHNFPLTGDQSYNAIYTALQTWGHYQLVSTPAQADLLLDLREIAPITDVTGGRGGVYSVTSPAFQITFKDAHTHTALWTLTSPVQLAGRKATRARWMNIAITNVVSRIKVLANQPLTPTEVTDLSTVPHYHGAAFAFILAGSFVAVGVAGGLILKHEYDQSVKNQNAALCAQNPFFCTTPAQ